MNWTSFTGVCLLSAAIGGVGCERETAEGNGADRLLPAAQSQHEDPPSGQTKREELHADHDHAARDDGDAGGEHAGHDHAADEHHEDAEPEQDVHADDVHDVHEGHDHADHDHGDEATTVVSLTPQERQRLHVEIATASADTLSRSAVFPGEIVANEDRMVHIVPRAGGIVREVAVTLGDRVDEGQALAWIESAQLARAKLDFYAAHTEVASRSIELPRARQIHDSTTKLLALLETEPDVEALEQLDEAEMGEFRGQLITAYAEYRAAKKTFERERGLYEKNVASESDYIEAEAAYKIARAAFTAARDIARYQSLMQYAEAAQERQVAEFEAVSAGQHLRLLGVDEKTIEDLLALVPRPRQGEGETRSVLESLGGEMRLGYYALPAPTAGYVTEKHLTLGEKVSSEESVMTIVDTSSVWVRFNVYQKDLARLEPGQQVTVDLGQGFAQASGTIEYISPLIDPQTRTAQARLELDNPQGTLRPGLYVEVRVDAGADAAAIVVPRDAVQVLDGENIVFVPAEEGFAAQPVELGRSDRDNVVILSGLEAGQPYVREGAFELKAKIVTSGLDPHAGHGH